MDENLIEQIDEAIQALDEMIRATKEQLDIDIEMLNIPETELSAYHMRDSNGRPILGDMIVAKANLLSAKILEEARTNISIYNSDKD